MSNQNAENKDINELRESIKKEMIEWLKGKVEWSNKPSESLSDDQVEEFVKTNETQIQKTIDDIIEIFKTNGELDELWKRPYFSANKHTN